MLHPHVAVMYDTGSLLRNIFMEPDSQPFVTCVSIASVAAFASISAAALILLWLWLRRVSPLERDVFERQISDLRQQLISNENPEALELEESLRKLRKELQSKERRLSKALETVKDLEQRMRLDADKTAVLKQPEESTQFKHRAARGESWTPGVTVNNGGKSELLPQRKKQVEEQVGISQLEDERKRYQDLVVRNQYLQDELKSARKYGSMEDRYAGSEVIEKLEKLNSNILQVADTIVEGLDLSSWASHRGPINNTDSSNTKGLAKILGRDLTRLLQTSENQDLGIVLQIAFQTSMVYHATSLISSWYYGSSGAQLFAQAYRSMQNDEIQAVFGRWRQLAITHLKHSRTTYDQYVMPDFINAFAVIILEAGYRHDSQITVHQLITNRFSNHLDRIIRAAVDIRQVIGEGITSCDLSVIWLQPGTPFETATMEEGFRSREFVKEREVVACVTDIGLKSDEKTISKWRQSVLLKPKVLLSSSLSDIRVRDT